MSKLDKEMNMMKVSDLKRIDPPTRTPHIRNRTKYPPHWQVRSDGWIWPSKRIRNEEKWMFMPVGNNCYGFSTEYEQARSYAKAGLLDEALAIYAKHHPETATWPIRFIHIQPLKTTRDILV